MMALTQSPWGSPRHSQLLRWLFFPTDHLKLRSWTCPHPATGDVWLMFCSNVRRSKIKWWQWNSNTFQVLLLPLKINITKRSEGHQVSKYSAIHDDGVLFPRVSLLDPFNLSWMLCILVHRQRNGLPCSVGHLVPDNHSAVTRIGNKDIWLPHKAYNRTGSIDCRHYSLLHFRCKLMPLVNHLDVRKTTVANVIVQRNKRSLQTVLYGGRRQFSSSIPTISFPNWILKITKTRFWIHVHENFQVIFIGKFSFSLQFCRNVLQQMFLQVLRTKVPLVSINDREHGRS